MDCNLSTRVPDGHPLVFFFSGCNSYKLDINVVGHSLRYTVVACCLRNILSGGDA